MATLSAKEIYEQHIKPLPPAEQLRLVELIARMMAGATETVVVLKTDTAETDEPEARLKRSIMELHGLGAEIWEGVDAQEYVNELRKEWDYRP